MSERQCDNVPIYRYTWPGQDEKCTCGVHALKLTEVAEALGFHLQLIPLTPQQILDMHCAQMVKEDNDG